MKVTQTCLAFCGDIHGQWRKLINDIKNYDIEDTAIILCGDIGMGFEKPNYYLNEFTRLHNDLKSRNIVLIAFRGNHDDPSYFKEIIDYGNIFMVPDYTVIETPTKNVLVIGGAISIDRVDRISEMEKKNIKLRRYKKKYQRNYWEDEQIVLDIDFLTSVRNIDIVCTHSSPYFCPPYSKDGLLDNAKRDKHLFHDCEVERSRLKDVHELLVQSNNITHWYYGHFHKSYISEYDGTRFECLDKNKITEYR